MGTNLTMGMAGQLRLSRGQSDRLDWPMLVSISVMESESLTMLAGGIIGWQGWCQG